MQKLQFHVFALQKMQFAKTFPKFIQTLPLYEKTDNKKGSKGFERFILLGQSPPAMGAQSQASPSFQLPPQVSPSPSELREEGTVSGGSWRGKG